MNNIEWTYNISKSSGQKKDKDNIIVDKPIDHKLSISAKGTEEQLLTLIQKLAPLISKTGGQETLDF